MRLQDQTACIIAQHNWHKSGMMRAPTNHAGVQSKSLSKQSRSRQEVDPTIVAVTIRLGNLHSAAKCHADLRASLGILVVDLKFINSCSRL